ncbi:MAG: hypothetical protein ACKVPY_15940 [Paracoccaceae bacterium]
MPLQNRVLPTGDIAAVPARGLFTGNRGGAFHRPDKTLGAARWKSKAWICCLLSYKGWWREVMAPRLYTELFFLDEAVALAAGHRPCALCRRADFRTFAAAWERAGLGPSRAPQMDRALHAARLARDGTGATHRAPCAGLPDGAMILAAGAPALLRGSHALPFAPEGYGPPLPRPDGEVAVLAPRPVVAVLAAGYRPVIHPSAGT